jgi:hypothetical protein
MAVVSSSAKFGAENSKLRFGLVHLDKWLPCPSCITVHQNYFPRRIVAQARPSIQGFPEYCERKNIAMRWASNHLCVAHVGGDGRRLKLLQVLPLTRWVVEAAAAGSPRTNIFLLT